MTAKLRHGDEPTDDVKLLFIWTTPVTVRARNQDGQNERGLLGTDNPFNRNQYIDTYREGIRQAGVEPENLELGLLNPAASERPFAVNGMEACFEVLPKGLETIGSVRLDITRQVRFAKWEIRQTAWKSLLVDFPKGNEQTNDELAKDEDNDAVPDASGRVYSIDAPGIVGGDPIVVAHVHLVTFREFVRVRVDADLVKDPIELFQEREDTRDPKKASEEGTRGSDYLRWESTIFIEAFKNEQGQDRWRRVNGPFAGEVLGGPSVEVRATEAADGPRRPAVSAETPSDLWEARFDRKADTWEVRGSFTGHTVKSSPLQDLGSGRSGWKVDFADVGVKFIIVKLGDVLNGSRLAFFTIDATVVNDIRAVEGKERKFNPKAPGILK